MERGDWSWYPYWKGVLVNGEQKPTVQMATVSLYWKILSGSNELVDSSCICILAGDTITTWRAHVPTDRSKVDETLNRSSDACEGRLLVTDAAQCLAPDLQKSYTKLTHAEQDKHVSGPIKRDAEQACDSDFQHGAVKARH